MDYSSSYSYGTTSSSTMDPAALMVFMAVYFFIILVVAIPVIIGMWKVFVKAGKPGWAALVPIYNTYVMVEIAQKPSWWFVMFFVPFANVIFSIMTTLEIGRLFGKDTVFNIFGLLLFPTVGWLMLGFGSAQYQGSTAPVAPTQPAPPAAPAV